MHSSQALRLNFNPTAKGANYISQTDGEVLRAATIRIVQQTEVLLYTRTCMSVDLAASGMLHLASIALPANVSVLYVAQCPIQPPEMKVARILLQTY